MGLLAVLLNLLSFAVWTTLSVTLILKDSTTLNYELKQVSTWSPLLDLVDFGFHESRVNGTLFPREDRPVARQLPNDEADKVWKEWELTRVFPISANDVARLGKDLETAVKLEDEYFGLGDDKYAATLDIYHQLHCVNMLRWHAYGPYYNKTYLDPEKEGFAEVHINHCIDILVQTIQCSGNPNLITMHWAGTQAYPFPDFNIQKKCINFDLLSAWRKENTVDMQLYVDVLGHKNSKPKNIKQRPAPDDEYKKIYGELADTGPYKHFDTLEIS
ncbi:hypothetical protein F5Y15DRAFT_423308 [Xylariaceae sp. FL0016]|nr:hypothetical protein F5Y15DRAFT_423308 [Xylariaceae sp. FL0016]